MTGAMNATVRLIVLSGLPGTGKSELANHLSRALGAPVFSVDPIESAIVRAGISRSFETGLAAYLVVEALARSELLLGRSVIVDAVNSVEAARDMWRSLARESRAELGIIECRCSDSGLHRARLASRQRGLAIDEPTWRDVERRASEWTAWSERVFVADSIAPSPENAERALAWLAV
ncbi:MAG: AAA family ATPase [Polyangiaceae bacterium]